MGNELQEVELRQEISDVERTAMALIISTDADYTDASEFLKKVKGTIKKVDDFWEPLRKSTYEAYKNVTTKKSEMNEPLKNTEKILKDKMSSYLDELKRRQEEEEAAARAAAKEEADRKIAEAQQAEFEGNFEEAENAMAEAEVMMQASESIAVAKEKPKVKGIIERKDYEVEIYNSLEVPIEYAGVELRPVDTSAVLALARATNGKAKIPGVLIKEKVSISVRT